VRSPLRPERYSDRQENPARVEALTDGIFSVAMTLLVLGLAVDAHEASASTANADLWRALVSNGIGWKLVWFLATFIVTGWFWIGHLLIFWLIERVDRIIVWWNIALLVPIVFLPFSTLLVGQFPHANLAGVIYVLNILAAAAMTGAVWFYAVRAGLLPERTPPELIRAVSDRLVFVMAVLIVVSLIAPFLPYFSIAAILIAMLYVAWTTGARLLVDK
jgi:uncharacterized membrane protein